MVDYNNLYGWFPGGFYRSLLPESEQGLAKKIDAAFTELKLDSALYQRAYSKWSTLREKYISALNTQANGEDYDPVTSEELKRKIEKLYAFNVKRFYAPVYEKIKEKEGSASQLTI